MARFPLRQASLDLRILARLLGRGPLLLLALWCGIAAVQEPQFFRQQGLDLAWPAVFAGADVMALAACACWAGLRRPHVYASTKQNLIDAAALLLACLFPHGFVILVTASLDLLQGTPTTWALVGHGAIRAALTWTPMAMLAAALGRRETTGSRALWALLAAFVLQAAIHPVWVVAPAGADKFWASALATAGGAVWTLRDSPPRRPLT